MRTIKNSPKYGRTDDKRFLSRPEGPDRLPRRQKKNPEAGRSGLLSVGLFLTGRGGCRGDVGRPFVG